MPPRVDSVLLASFVRRQVGWEDSDEEFGAIEVNRNGKSPLVELCLLDCFLTLFECLGSSDASGTIYILLNLHPIIFPGNHMLFELFSVCGIISFLRADVTEPQGLTVGNTRLLMTWMTAFLVEVLMRTYWFRK